MSAADPHADRPERSPEEFRRLLAAVRAGDSQALDGILRDHLPMLVQWLDRRVGGGLRARESISDLAQSVCREVLQDLHAVDVANEQQFCSWLLAQAGRKIVDRYRFHSSAKRAFSREGLPVSQCDASATAPTPSRHAVAREELDRVMELLAGLPEAQREAVVLHRLVGLDYDEVAQRLGRTEAAVRALVARGLAAVSRLL